ncbi:MAG: hypothetical protein JW748_08690 [Anaerolineales bacterium]|nr:hypothetical protein [Anaerolineales bacterium]
MKRWRLLILALVLAVSFSAAPAEKSQAQGGEIDWSDPWSAIYNNLGILQQVFGHFGLPINAGDSGYFFQGDQDVSACECYPSGDPQDAIWGDYHVQYMDFSHLDMLAIQTLLKDNYIIRESRQYQYEGMDIGFVIAAEECFTGSKHQLGYIQLIPGKEDESYGFSIMETCTDTKGDNMPGIEEVLMYFLATIKEYGFRSPAEMGQTALEPSPTPMVYLAPENPEAAGEITEAELEEAAALLAYDPSLMDDTQLPAMTGAAVAGAALGAALIQLLALMSARPQAPVYYSPATGKPAPLKQVQQEQAMMDSGHVYRDGQWHAPKGEYSAGPSILSEDYAREKAARDLARETQWAKERELRRKQNEAFDRVMELERQQLQAKHDLVRANAKYQLAKNVEWVADISMSVAARLAGPAGPAVEALYGRIKQLAGAASTTYHSGWQDAVDDLVVDTLVSPLPKFGKDGAGLLRIVAEEVVNKLAEDKAKDVIGPHVVSLHIQAEEAITGTPGIF